VASIPTFQHPDHFAVERLLAIALLRMQTAAQPAAAQEKTNSLVANVRLQQFKLLLASQTSMYCFSRHSAKHDAKQQTTG
jgi:hypothetical protein